MLLARAHQVGISGDVHSREITRKTNFKVSLTLKYLGYYLQGQWDRPVEMGKKVKQEFVA